MSGSLTSLVRRGMEPEGLVFDARIFIGVMPSQKQDWAKVLSPLMNAEELELCRSLWSRHPKAPEEGQILCFDRHPLQRWVVVLVDAERDMFRCLTLARQILKPLHDYPCRQLQVELLLSAPRLLERWTDAISATMRVLSFQFPRYTREAKAKSKAEPWHCTITVAAQDYTSHLPQIADRADHQAAANNQLRQLVMQAGNDLTPAQYRTNLKILAERQRLQFSEINQKKLRELGAGAFLAVAQGAEHDEAAVVKLSYEPTGKTKYPLVVVVGKGVTFDTGGHNLKSPQSMIGMHRDMGGSALAYALLALAAKEKWPVRLTAYLAIAENKIGPKAYKQNDVVTALNGKTIEIIDTDAEGRMLLADCLHLASEEKPDLLMDFATLTGACVRAISTRYSGVFTNRSQLHPLLIQAGELSGERVWPFPLDEDFKECLKSEIADIKQCRVSGGVDHIEAALFLQEFVGQGIPWVHLDLSASEHEGGLAHIDSEVTGFGLRFLQQFFQLYGLGTMVPIGSDKA